MFDFRIFIMNTIKSMYGNEPEYKVRKYAGGWFDKGVLDIEDLQEIDEYYTAEPAEKTDVMRDVAAEGGNYGFNV